jgi:hypothetical protein
MTTVEDLKRWYKDGKKAIHIVVVCDTYDWEGYDLEDYPCYVIPPQIVEQVYNLSKPFKY